MQKNKVYKLALFGNPVSHSLSPQIHQQFAQQFGLKIEYELIRVTSNSKLKKAVKGFFGSGGIGANITLPYKSNACKIVNNISEINKKFEVINTLYLNEKTEIFGENTDGIGFIRDLYNRCGFNCENKKILILGAGGASCGVIPEIIQQNPKKLLIANRTIEKAQRIANNLNSFAVTFEALEKLKDTFDLIIHASSLGHQGQTLKFHQHHVSNETICYDLSYATAAKAFVKFCDAMGVQNVHDGMGMLIEQAACSFNIWFDLLPETNSIKEKLMVQ